MLIVRNCWIPFIFFVFNSTEISLFISLSGSWLSKNINIKAQYSGENLCKTRLRKRIYPTSEREVYLGHSKLRLHRLSPYRFKSTSLRPLKVRLSRSEGVSGNAGNEIIYSFLSGKNAYVLSRYIDAQIDISGLTRIKYGSYPALSVEMCKLSIENNLFILLILGKVWTALKYS